MTNSTTNSNGKTHTPGPWAIEGRRGPGYIISAGTNAEHDGPADYVGVIDPMFYVAGEPSALSANVRLIAAAPELLSALKALVAIYDDEFGIMAPEMDAALAAISKAEPPNWNPKAEGQK